MHTTFENKLYTLKVKNWLESVALTSACASYQAFSPGAVIIRGHSQVVPACTSRNPGNLWLHPSKVKDTLKDLSS